MCALAFSAELSAQRVRKKTAAVDASDSSEVMNFEADDLSKRKRSKKKRRKRRKKAVTVESGSSTDEVMSFEADDLRDPTDSGGGSTDVTPGTGVTTGSGAPTGVGPTIDTRANRRDLDAELENLESLDGDAAGDLAIPGLETLEDIDTSLENDDLEEEGRFSGFEYDLRAQLTSWANVGVVVPPGQSVEGRGRLDAGASARIGSTLLANVNGRLRYATQMENGTQIQRFEVEPREMYLTVQGSRASMTLGNQVVRWGVSQFFNVNDPFNPLDFRDRTGADLAPPHRPILAARGLLSFENVTIEGVFVPFFAGHRMRSSGDRWGFFRNNLDLLRVSDFLAARGSPEVRDELDNLFESENMPGKSLQNVSGGGRISYRLGGLDAGFNMFYGWDRFPMIEADPGILVITSAFRDEEFETRDPAVLDPTVNYVREQLDAGESILTASHRRIYQFGGDLTFTHEKWLVKFESAVASSRTIYTDGVDPSRLPTVSFAGGVDYRLSDKLTVVGEGTVRYLVGGLPPGETPTYSTGDDVAVAGGVDYTIGDTGLNLRIGGTYSIQRGDWRVAPRLQYEVIPRLTLTLGATLLDGPSDSFGGVYHDNDHVFFALDLLAL